MTSHLQETEDRLTGYPENIFVTTPDENFMCGNCICKQILNKP